MQDVSEAVMDEVATRTPGFEAWQPEQWLTCCRDAAAFLGRAGAAELKAEFREAAPPVKRCLAIDYDLSGLELDEFFDSLSKQDQPTAYIFRCLHCRKYLAYVDQT